MQENVKMVCSITIAAVFFLLTLISDAGTEDMGLGTRFLVSIVAGVIGFVLTYFVIAKLFPSGRGRR